jgi:ABC-type phosphate/phosphonate transport system substrate-binding protein
LLVFPSSADQHAGTMTSTRLVANARMYSVTPETARAWHRLFDWLATTSGAPLDVIEHAYPARLPDLWTRPDLGAAFVCGWPYASRLRDLRIVAAPVPRLERAGGRPVYWTDMVVKADRPFRKLEDTFGGRIAFTAKDSHSGFNAVRRLLMQHASSRPDALYSTAIGPLITPRRSLESVLSGDADVAPIPLLVASAATDSAPIAKLRAALVGAGRDPTARGLLGDLVLEGFAEVEPADYDVTQSWARDAERAGWLGLAAREQAPAAS